LSNAHYQISLLHTLAGWPQRGLEHAKLVLETSKKLGQSYHQISAYFGLTLSSYYLAETHQAQHFARTGIELAERIQGWRMLGYLSGYAGSIDLTLGAIDSALGQAQKTIELGEQTGLNDVIAMGCRHAGDIFARLHEPETAIQYYHRGVEAAGEHFLGIDNLIRLGYVQCMFGQPEIGHQTLATSLALCQSYELGLGITITEFFQALAYAREGEKEKARLLAIKVRDDSQRQGLPTYYFDAIAVLASLAAEDGDLETALDLASQAANEARLIGNIWSELNAQSLLKGIYQQMDNPDNAPTRRIQSIMATLRANVHRKPLVEIFTKYEANYRGL
jgi:tetratricopeptide (TPR) repeat protein